MVPEYTGTRRNDNRISQNKPEGQALLNTGMERNIPEYAGIRRNNTGMKRNEQEWCQNIPERAGMTPK